MRTVLQTLAPAMVALVLFATIVMVRRMWKGDPAVQPADGSKMRLVATHVLPLLVACLAYNLIVDARIGTWAEVLTGLTVMATLTAAVFRYLEVVDPQLTR